MGLNEVRGGGVSLRRCVRAAAVLTAAVLYPPTVAAEPGPSSTSSSTSLPPVTPAAAVAAGQALGTARASTADAAHETRGPAGPEMKRLALVIGNAAYTPPLKNPLNDARAMTAALSKVGWEVTTLTDANPAEVMMFVEQFGEFVAPGDEVVFYYSGHGVQLGGENFLLPVGVRYATEADVRLRSLAMASLFEILDRSRPRSLVIILDACRDNPFPPDFKVSTRGGLGKGLAAIENPPRRSLIAFAASEGETASDGTGKNGTFTEALLEQLPRPYLSALDVLTEVNRVVRERTNDKQVPEFKVKLDYAFHFNPALPPVPAVTQRTPSEFEVQFLDQSETYKVSPPGNVEQVVELAKAAVSRSVRRWKELLHDDIDRLNFVNGRLRVLDKAIRKCRESSAFAVETARLTRVKSEVEAAIRATQLASGLGVLESALQDAPSACQPTDWHAVAMLGTGAVGVAGLIGGSVLLYLASDNWDRARAACPDYSAAVGCATAVGPRLSEKARGQARAATWVYAVGAAGLGAATALWLYDQLSRPNLEPELPEAGLQLSLSVSGERAGLALTGSFY